MTCFNTKMNLHFGHSLAHSEGLYMDFEYNKNQYKLYEQMNPNYRMQKLYERGMEEDKV